MPTYLTPYIPFIYTGIFSVILVAVVPRAEIRRLSIYGIIFGGIMDFFVVGVGILTRSFLYINYEPFGLMGIHFVAPISWSVFFILYFYFMPRKKPYVYLYVLVGIMYSILFCQMITKIGVLRLSHGIIDSIVPFVFWFPTVSWAYYRLTENDHRV